MLKSNTETQVRAKEWNEKYFIYPGGKLYKNYIKEWYKKTR